MKGGEDDKVEFVFTDLIDVESKTWSLIGNMTENTQYGYCTPLRQDQITMLQKDLGSLEEYIIDNQLMDKETLEKLEIK